MAKKTEHPQTLSLICPAGLVLAADGDGKKLPTFSMVAYTGAPIRVSMWCDPVVIDLGGVSTPTQSVAIRRNHDPSKTIGHSDAVAIRDGQIVATGVLSFDTESAREVASSAKNGFPWQASVGMDANQVEFIAEGKSTEVNGRMVDGPIDVIRKSTLREISFVDLGADSGTNVSVAASAKETEMAVKNQDKESPAVEASEPATKGAAATVTETKPEVKALGPVPDPAAQDLIAAMRTQSAGEMRRQAAIQKLAGREHGELAAKAIEENWSLEKAELEMLRAARPTAPAVHVGGGGIDAATIEAAACIAGGLRNIEKKFEPKILDAAHKAFKGRIGLQDIIAIAAQQGGWQGRSVKGDMRGALEAAFSTLSLPGIMSNTANKFLLEGFMAVERTYANISSTKNVSDFKTNTSYRLNGGFEYEEIAPDGEFTHGTVSEDTFENRARTYGKMFAITRTDIINDDLGALTQIPTRLGRGAALKLNKVFWTAFLDNATFFSVAHANLITGAGGNLSLTSLQTALALFRNQTDPDGNPVPIEPQWLLVPPSLEVTAFNIFNSIEYRDTTTSVKFGTSNVFAGRFRPIVSTYLSNSTIPGFSTIAWYLLADPSALSTIEIAYLNGVQEPTVETAEMDFNVLGIQMRGYHDFGVAKQEYRAGVKSEGTT